MTDKKLTDNKLMELLEYKSKTGCDLCDIKNGNWCITCNYDLMKNTLDLINRLQEKDKTRHKVFETKCEELEIAKAENERLQDILIKLREIHDRAKGIIATQNGEIERLKNELFESNIEIAELYKCKFSAEDVAQNIIRAKAEAYKEFAEKLENRILSMLTTATLEEKEIICACIGTNNNVLKELVGEDNESKN